MATDIWGGTLTQNQRDMMRQYTQQTGEQVTEEPATQERFQSWLQRFAPNVASNLERSMTEDISGSLSPITESNVSPFNALSNKVRDVVEGPIGEDFRNITRENIESLKNLGNNFKSRLSHYKDHLSPEELAQQRQDQLDFNDRRGLSNAELDVSLGGLSPRELKERQYNTVKWNRQRNLFGLGKDLEDRLYEELFGPPPFEQGPEMKIDAQNQAINDPNFDWQRFGDDEYMLDYNNIDPDEKPPNPTDLDKFFTTADKMDQDRTNFLEGREKKFDELQLEKDLIASIRDGSIYKDDGSYPDVEVPYKLQDAPQNVRSGSVSPQFGSQLRGNELSRLAANPNDGTDDINIDLSNNSRAQKALRDAGYIDKNNDGTIDPNEQQSHIRKEVNERSLGRMFTPAPDNTFDTITASPKLTTTPTTTETTPTTTETAPTTTATTPTTTTPAPKEQGEGKGLLAFLGRNPEIVGALGLGAQGIGQMLQGRAQDKANRRTRDQQAINNAIAAFTGGPAERAVGETATSTGGGVLSALGKAMSGYGDTRFDTDEALLDRESSERIAKMQADANRYVAQMNARGRSGSGDGDDDSDITDIQRAGSAYGVYWDALGRGEISGPLQGHLDKFPILGQVLYPTDKATRNLGEATALTLAVAIQGSRPSEGDRIAMEILLPRIEDTIELREIKDKNIRALLAAGEALRAQGMELGEGWTTIVDPSDGSFDPQKMQTYVQPIGKKNPSGGTSTASAGGDNMESWSDSELGY